MLKTYFNPGCALSIYKPEMEQIILKFLKENYGDVALHKICCHHDPLVEEGSLIINVCAGCDRRFRSLYEGLTTISIWEVIDKLDTFEYPDYIGLKMSVHDACPVREKPQVHQAVRNLLKKMNIDVVETKFYGTRSICCGDDFYQKLPLEQVHQRMKVRADSMPCSEVCVYCVSCIKSMHIGGKTPRHLMDLLMGEVTEPQTYDTVQWHGQLEDYIQKH
jgi:Fe-S oxidoreductase